MFRCSFQLIGLKLVNDNLRAFDIVFTDTGKRKRILGSPFGGRMRKDRHHIGRRCLTVEVEHHLVFTPSTKATFHRTTASLKPWP